MGVAPAARTAVNGGVIAARCPACGAELRLGLDGTCAHCKASVTNGSVDWVVVDVQPAAYVGYSADSSLGFAAPSIPEGVAALTAADKDFSLGIFEGTGQDGVSRAAGCVVQAEPGCRPRIHESRRLFHLERAA